MSAPTLFPENLGRVGVKICGLTSGQQAEEVVVAGADAIGVNLWPRSKRFHPLADAITWLHDLAGQTVRVAVTVNASDDELTAIHESGAFDLIQLHGDEAPNRVESLTQQGLIVFKAAGVKDRDTLEGLAEFPAGVLLLDAYAPTEYGGTGETMDWALGAEAVRRFPERQIVLAGGLTDQNVAEAIRQTGVAGVDTASGVESAPGVKDLGKVKAFIRAARGE